MNQYKRKPGQPHDHPLAQVAEMIADDIRDRETAAAMPKRPIAYITQHGDLYCCACVQPTAAQLDTFGTIEEGDRGKPDRCDLCGKLVEP